MEGLGSGGWAMLWAQPLPRAASVLREMPLEARNRTEAGRCLVQPHFDALDALHQSRGTTKSTCAACACRGFPHDAIILLNPLVDAVLSKQLT